MREERRGRVAPRGLAASLARPRRRWRLTRPTAFATALSLAAAPALVIVGATPAAAAAPTITVSASAPAEVLAGENVTYSLSATNTGGTDGYNLAFVVDVPVGLSFVGSSAGAPEIYSATEPPPTGSVPIGFERWVWEDVSDLPATGSYSLSFVAFPVQPPMGTGETLATNVSPVGSTVSLSAYAYLGGDPTLLPVFTGATGVGGATATAETGSAGPDVASTDVIPFDISKTEPSPESELLRGVHDQTTIYRIEVENTSEGATNNAVLVDWIPAGIEFLQCGTIDNSTVDRELGDGTVNEYLGAPDLSGTPLVATNCPTPATVETVVATAGDATTYGVTAGETYTRVQWNLGTLAAGSTTIVRYAAAVPLYENTTTFDGASTPTAASLGQAANLDNNNGPSTRHGDLATHEDGDTWTNRATISGDYAGVVRTGTVRATTDADSETIHAMDLSVLKAITAGDTFDTGATTTFELTLRASEYMISSDIVLTDTFSNGLCPLVPAATPIINTSGLDISDCTATAGTVTGADVVSLEAFPDGSFELILRPTSGAFPDPDDFELDINDTHTITYAALNRDEYELADEYGPTTSGDGFGNTVEFDAVSDATANLLPWFPDTWNTWDDSGATMPTDFTTIDKRVMARVDVEQDLAPGVNPCTAPGATWEDDLATNFRMGDTACFELSVVFPSTVDVRNPIITDFLPDGLTYEGFEVIAGSVGPTIPAELDAGAGRLQWELGTVGDGGDLYVPRGSTFTAHLWATVDEPSNGLALDKPENLLKYRQQNVDGELFFLREEAAVEVDPEMQLTKGVLDVTDNALNTSSTRSASSQAASDGTDFNSDRDGIQVREGEVVTYRIDLTTLPYAASNAEVWDALPPGITKADVSAISDGGVAYDDGDLGYPTDLPAALTGRTIVIWTGVGVAYDAGEGEARKTLTYDVTVPTLTGVATTLDNDASIISYQSGINSSSDPNAQTYYPHNSFDESDTARWNTDGVGTVDDSGVYLPTSSLAKSVTSPVATNNSNSQAVKGEVVEFDLTFTVPAYTSVFDVVMYDQMRNTGNTTWIAPSSSSDWVFDPGAVTVTHPGGTTSAGDASFSLGGDTFTIDTADGILTFPSEYTNATASNQDFTLHLEAYIDPDSTWTHSTSNNRPRDRATVNQTGQGTLTRSVNTYLVEPNPQIAKSVDSAIVTANEPVTFTLTASNGSGRPTSYDSQVIDCVPSELGSVTLDAPSQGSASIVADASCTGTRIVWDVGTLAAGDSETLTYDATVSPAAAGGATYQNTATITGYSLDDELADRADYTDSTDETVTVVGGGIDKSVDSPTATIGEERDFTIEVTLPADVNFYDLAITDTVPSTMEVDASSVSITCLDSALNDCSGDLPGGGAPLAAAGTTIGWWFDDVTWDPLVRTITVSYTATVLDQVATNDGDDIVNSASMTWNLAPTLGAPPADASYTGTDSQGPDTATVTIVEPDPSITKQVNGLDSDTVAPGDTFTYTVGVTNDGTSTAYSVTVVDTVPTGVVVDESSISPAGVLAGEDATTGGGTITWTISSIAVDATQELTYDATLAPSTTLDGSSLTNDADITAYYSHDNSAGFDPDERRLYDGPTEDAVVTPDFPDPVLTKTPTGTIAYIGEDHEFTIEVLNDGTSTATAVEVVDTLPAGWSYVAGSATVDSAPLADPAIAGQVLTWSTLPDIDPDDTITIVYEAVADDAATWDATNTGSGYAHTNDAVVTVEDTSGSGSNLSGDYTDSDDADVFIHVTDIAIDKAHTGDPTAGSSFSWTLTVTNDAGADPAVGPIVITDTLPADAVYTGVSGTGWSGALVSPGVVELTHAGPLAPGGALPIATVSVTLPDDVNDSTDFTNNASVTSTTFELELDDNDDSDPASTVIVADVELTKSTVGTAWTAGESISWELVATNNGPSVARSDFTLTDNLPAEIDWTTVSASGTGWTCDPVTLGGVLVCTWSGTALAVGDSLPTLTVSGDILTGATGTIDNDAEIDHPTPDPDPDNNDDGTSDPISTDADLALTKTTVTTDIPALGVGRFRIEIVNNGPSDALVVVVDDTLPAGLTYAGNITAAAGDTWACVGAGADVDCALTSNGGTLVNGDSTWFEFDVNADASVTGAVLNTATVSSDTPDPDASNNTDDSATAPELIVIKTVNKKKVARGGKVVYSLAVQSTSYGYTDDVTLTDPIHAKLRVDAIEPALSTDPTVPDWLSCDHTGADPKGYGGTVVCILDGTLERGRTTPEVLIRATVRPNTNPGTLLNVATVEWTDPLEGAVTVYSDVDDIPIRVRLTDAELAATGPEQAVQMLGAAALMLMVGSALVMVGHRTRPRGSHFLGRAGYLS